MNFLANAIFLKNVTSPQKKPQAGPSGGVPEEGIAIIRDGSSTHLVPSEDPPVG